MASLLNKTWCSPVPSLVLRVNIFQDRTRNLGEPLLGSPPSTCHLSHQLWSGRELKIKHLLICPRRRLWAFPFFNSFTFSAGGTYNGGEIHYASHFPKTFLLGGWVKGRICYTGAMQEKQLLPGKAREGWAISFLLQSFPLSHTSEDQFLTVGFPFFAG